MTNLTIVMYHYVRDLGRSRYPLLKALDEVDFRRQLDYFEGEYTPVSMGEVLGALTRRAELPEKAVLLTFDDGFVDHYSTVFPILSQRNLHGAFFPPASAVQERTLLDVHAIHHVLASAEAGEVLNAIGVSLEHGGLGYTGRSFADLARDLLSPSRFDVAEVACIKRLLQRELPAEVRGRVVAGLLERFVGVRPEVLAHELYLTVDQLRVMRRAGMHIGGHGWAHQWLASLTPASQRLELSRTRSFLESLGIEQDSWTLAYPYGSYDGETMQIAESLGFRAALTTQAALASLDKSFELARFDTNDLPLVAR